MSTLPYPLWWLLLLYHGDVLTDGADVVWGIGGDAGVVGLSRAEVCHPEGSVLPVGGIGGAGIELQAVLLPLGDVGGGTGHGRPGYRRRSRWAGPDRLRKIRRIAGEGGPDCTWDDTTVILLGRPLYGPDDRCNGYVCRLTTGGMETGYLQVDALGGELCTGAYSFTGIPAYEGLAEEGGGTASEERLYFFGGISYGVRLEDGSFRLMGSPERVSAETAAEQYRHTVEQVQRQRAE